MTCPDVPGTWVVTSDTLTAAAESLCHATEGMGEAASFSLHPPHLQPRPELAGPPTGFHRMHEGYLGSSPALSCCPGGVGAHDVISHLEQVGVIIFEEVESRPWELDGRQSAAAVEGFATFI